MKMVPLGEVAEIERHGVDPSSQPPNTRYVGLEHIERGGRIIGSETVGSSELASTKFTFTAEHVLFGKLRPNLGKVCRPEFAGVCSTDILPIRPGPRLSRNYLAHYLVQPSMVEFAASRTSGANLPRLSPDALARFPVPLPPLDEQRRIATILDHADALRAKRRQVIAGLDELAQSIFVDMFGGGGDRVRFDSTVSSMRNGVSPSTNGTVIANVLTLSAITQGSFDPTASKQGTFDRKPGIDQRVSSSDFLICRGNGNAALVGAGVHPSAEHVDLVFPDTVIAARMDQTLVHPGYLEAAWRQPNVRTQILAAARTTNGTYKINQKSLGGVEIQLPPIDRQVEFAQRVSAIPRPSTSELDALFASLQSRAFRGEL